MGPAIQRQRGKVCVYRCSSTGANPHMVSEADGAVGES